MPAERDVQRDLYRYTGAGVHFAAVIGVFAFGGYWMDGRFDTGPWLLLVGVFLGFGLGLTSLVSKLGPGSTTTSSSRAVPPTDPPAPPPNDPPDHR